MYSADISGMNPHKKGDENPMKSVREKSCITAPALNAMFAALFILASMSAGISAEEPKESVNAGSVWVFFNDAAMTRFHDRGIDEKIDMDTGANHNDYAKVWVGRIKAPTTGEVTFSADADNGLRLWINEKVVIDGWRLTGAREGRFSLKQNQMVAFRLHFFQSGGTAHMRLYWSWEDHPRELIPASAFWHTDKDLDFVKNVIGDFMKEEAVTQTTAQIGEKIDADDPVRLGSGPQLFLDDYMIAEAERLERVFHSPKRLPRPVLDFPTFVTTQHHASVLYDPERELYRFWYTSAGSKIRHAESKDGVHWEKPTYIEIGGKAPMTFGVIDDRRNATDAGSRLKMVCLDGGGMSVFVSPDGLNWTGYENNPVVVRIGDIVGGLFFDPIRKRYMATFKMCARLEDGFEPAPLAGKGFRRLVCMSVSKDFYHWEKPWRICVPDQEDEGLLEFYGMRGIHARGSLLIGFVRVLRDDLPHEEGAPARGIGYTVLAISRDGEKWYRFRQPFLDRSPVSGTWDRAMTWIGDQLPMGDEVYLYYGGYATGHKPGMHTGGRQLGMAKLRKDGYASLRADARGGTLLTPLFTFGGDRLELNVDAAGKDAEVQVEIRDAAERPLKGFSLHECDPVRGERVAHAVTWRGKSDVSSVAGKPVKLRIALRSADLYAFEFSRDRGHTLKTEWRPVQ